LLRHERLIERHNWVELESGHYSIALASGWSLECFQTDSGFETVDATLVSANPQSFDRVARETTNVEAMPDISRPGCSYFEGSGRSPIRMRERPKIVRASAQPNASAA
jgi:hypothetical protein